MDYRTRYVKFLKNRLKLKRPLRVVFDSSNGSSGPIIRALAANQTRLTIQQLNARPDGNFPAHGPDPSKPGALNQLRRAVRKFKAECGIIFDADGDRVFFVDQRGRPINPEHTAMIISKNLKGPVVLDERLGYAARDQFKKQKHLIVSSRTGHTFIKKEMRKSRAVFGAEPSGHYYFKSFFSADAGIFAALQFLNALTRLGQPLLDWLDGQPQYFRSGEINFKVPDKVKVIRRLEMAFRRSARRISKLDGLRMEFETKTGRFWFGVRASNTEDLLRLNIEADEKNLLAQKLKRLTALISASK